MNIISYRDQTSIFLPFIDSLRLNISNSEIVEIYISNFFIQWLVDKTDIFGCKFIWDESY